MAKLLLHVCCAPCGAYVIDLLKAEYEVTAYFYNPNIYPEEEYKRRLSEVSDYFKKNGLPLVSENYDQENWFGLTKGHEKDPERGDRCTICYKMRLERTAQYAKENSFDFFTTDLSISPHKDAERINKIGKELGETYRVKFLEANFKKKDGYKKSLEISRNQRFYRQDYCGCLYSLKQRRLKDTIIRT